MDDILTDDILTNDILVVRTTNTSKLPTKAHSGDAGWDLYANIEKEIEIEIGDRQLIPIGCKFAIPEGYYGRIADRSSYAWVNGIHVFAGVVDSKYRGEVKVVLTNLSNEMNFIVNPGDKIAQMVITKIHTGNMTEVDNLDYTERSERGFGSSGYQ